MYLSTWLYTYVSICQPTYLLTHLRTYLPACMPTYLLKYQPTCMSTSLISKLPACLLVYLFIYLLWLFICLAICLSLCLYAYPPDHLTVKFTCLLVCPYLCHINSFNIHSLQSVLTSTACNEIPQLSYKTALPPNNDQLRNARRIIKVDTAVQVDPREVSPVH